MPITKSSLKALLDKGIVNTLQSEPLLGYRQVAALYEVSTDYIVDLAREHGVTRPHGRKPGIGNTKKAVL
jgi:hypothetical protein